MFARVLREWLSPATGMMSVHAQAALTPTIEFEEGPLATVPVTGGSVSGAGLTATGVPLIGNANQSVLQFCGTASLGAFNPLLIEVTEFNLTSLGVLNSFVAAINGTLPTLSGVTWNTFVDPTNTPFGTADLIATNGFSNPGSLISVGYTDTVP